MKNILFIMLLALFSSVYASDYKILAGLEYGQSKGTWNDYTGDLENNFGLRVGTETKETRIFFSYNYSLVENFNFANTDYTSHIAAMNFEAKTKKYYGFLRAFAGMHLGAIYSTWDLGFYPPLSDEDATDFLFGGQTGVIVDVIENIYFEAGYRLSLTTASDSSINPGNIQTFYGALNLKF